MVLGPDRYVYHDHLHFKVYGPNGQEIGTFNTDAPIPSKFSSVLPGTIVCED
jgi:hypothetical protein